MKKVIVIGVIALFIGVSFQSALAVEPKSSVDTIEKEEDCDCQAVSDINLVKLKSDLNRLKVYTRILSKSSELNPLLQKRIERLGNLLSDWENDNTNGWNFPILCGILYFLFVFAVVIMLTTHQYWLVNIIDDIGDGLNCFWSDVIP